MVWNIEKFGRNLGFGIKPWVKRFGVNWQMHLAQALLNPHRIEYKGLNVPHSREMRERAEEFIRHNEALQAGFKGLWHQMASSSNKPNALRNITHHSIIQKAYDDTLRYKAVYGNQKYVSPENQKTIQEYKEAIRYAGTRNEKRELKSKLREFQKKVTQNRWEIEAQKYSVIPRADPAIERKNTLEASNFIKQHHIEKLKMQRAQLAATGETFWEKQFHGDPGEEIGKGQDIHEVTTDPKDWIRLANYLKKARFIKLSVYKGIMRSKNTHLRAFLRRNLGNAKYNEFFLSYNASKKYATAAYFKPGSEYGTMRSSYDNTKGEVTPLQRMRQFNKSGKEILKDKK